MNRFHTRLVVGVALVGALSGLTACASTTSTPTTGTEAGQVAAAVEVLIDVRTPQEFAAGHLTGAVNIPVEADDFLARVTALDPTGRYAVYCRTGRRSALAVEQMRAAGFVDLLDLGGLEQAQTATGLEVVR